MAKNVDFEVNVIGADKAAGEFKKVTESVEEMSPGMKIAMADVAKYKAEVEKTHRPTKELTEATGDLTNGMGSLLGGLIGGAGVQFALMATRTILTTLTQTEKEAAEITIKFTNELLNSVSAAEMLAVSMGKVNQQLRLMTDEQLEQRRLSVEKQKYDLETGFGGMWKSLIGTAKAEHDAMVALLAQITQQQADRKSGAVSKDWTPTGSVALLKAQIANWTDLRDNIATTTVQADYYNKKIIETTKVMNDAFPFTKKGKEKKGVFVDETTVRYMTDLNDAYRDYLNILDEVDKRSQHIANTLNNMGTKRGMTFGSGGQLAALLGRGIDTNELKQMGEKYQKEQEWIQRNADFFQSEFDTAWESVFGKADNLFTRYLAMWADQFANNLFNMKKGTSFLDLIPGFGFFSNLFNKPQSNPQPIYLQVDKTIFAKVVLDAGNRANKLRLS